MKKILLIIFVALLVMLPFVGTNNAAVAFAASEDEEYKQSEIYKFVEEFLADCPSRSGVENQRSAANWLAEKFSALVGFDVKPTSFGDGNTILGNNVEVRLKGNGSSEKQIIVGAHYDSTGPGANDNASGIAAMYFTMKNLVESNVKLPFDVVFVAFGGEEEGLLGSQHYLDSMSSVDRQNTMVMFNLDSVGGGDNLYVFCENKSTDLANLILKNANGQILEKPHAVGVFPVDVYGYGYYEFIQGSDHTPFRLQDIPTAMFFAGNFSGFNFVESKDSSKNVMNSNSDNLSNMDAFWGDEFVNKIQTVAQTLTVTLMDDDFLSVAENAKSQLVNNSLVFGTLWPTLASVVILAIAVILGILYYRKLQKRAILGTVEAKEQTKVFTQPSVEDVFSFDEKDKK